MLAFIVISYARKILEKMHIKMFSTLDLQTICFELCYFVLCYKYLLKFMLIKHSGEKNLLKKIE